MCADSRKGMYLYGSPGTDVIKSNSFCQSELNFVAYEAAPENFLVLHLGGDNSASDSESVTLLQLSESAISNIFKVSFQYCHALMGRAVQEPDLA